MYYIYGDYGYTSETLLEEFESYADARRWVDGYTDAGDFGGYTVIEIARFAGNEYVVEYRVDAEDWEDETVFYEDEDEYLLDEY
jgi:hypothetical protein